MCDNVDFHEPGEKNSYSNFDLDTDEIDCYSSACEDDESIETYDDEGSSDVFEPFVPEPTPSDCGESSDVDILDYRSSPSLLEDKLVRSPDVDGPVKYPDDGFKGFDDNEIDDNQVLLRFKKFTEIECLCVHQIKEEEEEGDGHGARDDIIPSPLPQLDYEEIKDEDTQGSKGNICSTAPLVRIRKAKTKADSILQELREMHGEGEQDSDDDDHDYDVGDDDLDDSLLDYGLDKQRKSVGAEVDIENQRRGLWSCDLCNFRTDYKRVINQHQWSHKLGGDWFKCSICGLKFKDTKLLSSHVQKEHTEPDSSARLETHSENLCSICDLEFENSRCLHAHIKKQHPSSIKYFYNCALCDHSTNNKRSHRNHI